MVCVCVCVGKIALQDQAALRGTDRGERDCISSNPNWKGQEDHGPLGQGSSGNLVTTTSGGEMVTTETF